MDESSEIFAFLNDDSHNEDCLDYFATVLLHHYPDLIIERFEATEWRQGWKIMLPPQPAYSRTQVEELVIPLRDMLFWKKDILVPYLITPYEQKVE